MKTKMSLKLLFKILMYIVLTLCAVITALDVYTKINQHTPKNWKTYPIYSIVLTDTAWQKTDVRMPIGINNSKGSLINPKIAIPFRYHMDRKDYSIGIEVNPSGRINDATLQILATRKLGGDILTIKPQWDGNCGMINKVSKNGKLDKPNDGVNLWDYLYFTNPKAIGFIWSSSSRSCKLEPSQALEHSSQFPIILEIYHGDSLIGREEVPIKIFENGNMRFKPVAIYLWKVILNLY